MEQGQYWMWMKRRQMLKSTHDFQAASINPLADSWEEKAFAEDAAAGSLGGCMWPPRSYSCSFCKREFRSAQALGGHMNVHRRDRARLKQSLISTQNEVISYHQTPVTSSLDSQYPPEISTLGHNLDPNSSPSTVVVAPPSRVSASSIQENFSEQYPNHSSSINVQNQHKGSSCAYASKPEVEKIPKGQEEYSICMGDDHDHVETGLSVGLNSVFCRNRSTGCCDDEAMISCKRPKTAVSTLLPFLLSSDHKYPLQFGPMEELDLELRLGDPPKVK